MRILTSLTIVILFMTCLPIQAEAFTSTDNHTSIEINDIDIAPTSTPIQPRRTKPSITPEEQPQLIRPVAPLPTPIATKPKKFFSFRVESSEIDFGIVDATNPVIRTHRLMLDPGYSPHYSVFAYQNHPLKLSSRDTFIPDTSCDDGVCNETTASLWENTLTYGFGYRCDTVTQPSICSSQFTKPGTYRQFIDVTKKESGTSILNGGRESDRVQARLTYKLNVSGTQPPGDYLNAIVLIAAPAF